MHTLYLASVWLHIVAVAAWLGGMLFLVLVVVPWMRKGDRAAGARILRETGARFRAVGWAVFAIVLVTGSFNLYVRGVRLGSFVDPVFLLSPFGRAVVLKLALFVAVVGLSAVHDFVIGPRATEALVRAPASAEAESLRRAASVMGRVSTVLALALVAVGVVIVRGCE